MTKRKRPDAPAPRTTAQTHYESESNSESASRRRLRLLQHGRTVVTTTAAVAQHFGFTFEEVKDKVVMVTMVVRDRGYGDIKPGQTVIYSNNVPVMTAQASGSAVLARQGGPATSSAKAAVLAEDTDGSEYAGSISGDGTAASGLRRCSRCRAHKDVSQFKVKVAATGPSYASCNKCSVR